MEAFFISTVQTVLGDRIAQKCINHLNAKWHADNNHRLEKALSSCQRLRDLAKQIAESASVLDEFSTSAAFEHGTSCGEVPLNAAVEVMSNGMTVSEGVSEGVLPGKNGSDDISPVFDVPALTRTRTLETPYTVPTTPVGPHVVAETANNIQVPSLSPHQISDRKTFSLAVEDILSRGAKRESSAVHKAEDHISLHEGLAWAGYGRKTRFIRRRSSAECALSSNSHQLEIVEEKFEGDYPVHPSQMIGEGAFRIGRCADVNEMLQEMKRRLGPHIETILQMTIRLLGEDTKVRGHEFTYHDLYCMLYEHRKKSRKPAFVVKTLDNGIVVQEGFPIKPVPLTIYPQEILCPIGDQIYRSGKASLSAIFGDTAGTKETERDTGTDVLSRTNLSTNVPPNVKPQVRFDIPETGGRPPIPTGRAPQSRQPRRRIHSACDPKITNPITLKVLSISSKTVSTVVTKDEAHGSIHQVQTPGRSKHKMDKNNGADHGLFSSLLRRQLGQASIRQVQPRGPTQHNMDDTSDVDRDLFQSPLRRGLDRSSTTQVQPRGPTQYNIDEIKETDRGLFQSPIRRAPDRSFTTQVQTHGVSQHNMDEASDADRDLFQSPLRHGPDHSPTTQVQTRRPTQHDMDEIKEANRGQITLLFRKYKHVNVLSVDWGKTT
ncbi:hypothetical protein MMC34_007537 [Xylographa carneopallida]|nr:hypothetical protein [Xylographa carneopallida]